MGKTSESSPSDCRVVRLKQILKSRKPDVVLNLPDKLKVIDLLESGQSERTVAAVMGVSRPQINRIRVNKDKLRQLAADKVFQSTAKIMVNLAKFPDIDEAVYKWFCELRNPQRCCKPFPLPRGHIQARALHEEKLRGIVAFKASDGWCRNSVAQSIRNREKCTFVRRSWRRKFIRSQAIDAGFSSKIGEF